MRVVALIATYNERRFIDSCLANLERHGVDAYLIDNSSSDDTVARAERWLDRNLVGIASHPRGEEDLYDWRALLRRKEELAREMDADWFIHMDPDEVRLPPVGLKTLAEALERVDAEGFNAVDFAEFTFVPTREDPDHDHPEFEQTLRTYYPFEPPRSPHQLKAWKAHPEAELASGGHTVRFPGVKPYPRQFPMKHYMALSVSHAIEKYVERRYASAEVASGWHGWRATLTCPDIRLPSESELSVTFTDADLDRSNSRKEHWLEELAAARPPPGFHVVRPEPPEERPPGGGARIVHRGSGQRPEIALTFDDGPSRWTAEIATTFERHGGHATFFARGAAVGQRPQTIAELASAGHDVGNHLWSHPDSSTLSQAELREEIARTAAAIEAAGAPPPRLIRPPYFKGPQAVAKAAQGTGASAVVLRSIGSSDWAASEAAEIVGPVLRNAQPGDIVCLHDGVSPDKRDGDSREPTAAAVRQLVPALIARGLTPVTVSRLLS